MATPGTETGRNGRRSDRLSSSHASPFAVATKSLPLTTSTSVMRGLGRPDSGPNVTNRSPSKRDRPSTVPTHR